MKKHLGIIIALALAASALALPCAAEPYKNYTYNYQGIAQEEPQAYVPDRVIDGAALGTTPLNSPSDVFVAADGSIYIADSGNNRILIANPEMKVQKILTNFTYNGAPETFNNPQGIFVSENNRLYIADTGNERIVVFNQAGTAEGAAAWTAESIFGRPQDALFTSNYKYVPIRIAVDNADRIYVVSLDNSQGIIEMDAQGNFVSYIGAVQVMPDFGQLLRRILPFEFLKTNSALNIPTEYSSIAIDEKGFIMGTVGIIDPERFSPEMFIHRLSPSGTDVLKRNGTNPPIGDMPFYSDTTADTMVTSYLCDIACRDSGIYSVLDRRAGRIFTYSFDGELMYIFGGLGNQKGQFSNPVALDVYDGDRYLVVDSTSNQIVSFKPTVYGQTVSQAVSSYYHQDLEESGELWKEALAYTSKSELVYNGVAKAEYKAENYESAMYYYRLAQNRDGYSKAFGYYRNEILEKYFIWFVGAAVAAICLIVLAVALVRRRVKAAGEPQRIKSGPSSRLAYPRYLIFHPFKGFWDLKRENMGTPLSATVIVLLLVLVFILRRQLTGFVINQNDLNDLNIVVQFSYILLPFLIWCIANWCVTTLVDGEGTFKDIYIASAYAFVPIILLNIPMLILSNLLTLEEMSLYYLLDVIAIIWTVFLMLIGIMTVHQFSMRKTIATIVVALVGMAILIAIGLLFLSLIQQMISFVTVLKNEIVMRN